MFRVKPFILKTIGVLTFSTLALSYSYAFYITFGAASPVTASGTGQMGAIGTTMHTFNGGETDTGVFVGGRTSASAGGGPVGASNSINAIDTISRPFTVHASNDDEVNDVAKIRLDAAIEGVLTANPAIAGTVFAQEGTSKAEVLLGGTPVLSVTFPLETSGGRGRVPVNNADTDSANLLLEQEYILKLTLDTYALATWDGKNATAAKSDFLNTLTGSVSVAPEPSSLLLFCGGAIGPIAYAWRRRKKAA